MISIIIGWAGVWNNPVHAFTMVPSTSTTTTATATALFSTKEVENKIMYGEQSRTYRRTVYTAEDWLKHRDPNRFFRNLRTIFASGVLQQVSKEVGVVSLVAFLVDFWNCVFILGYQDFQGQTHNPIVHIPHYLILELPIGPFQLSSTILGLLLVFRTNSSYSRWNEARTVWGKIINHSRNIMRAATAWTLSTNSTTTPTSFPIFGQENDETEILLNELTVRVWEFSRCLQVHLWSPSEDEMQFQLDVQEKLENAQEVIDSKHRPTRALYDLAKAVNALPLSAARKIEIDKSVVQLGDMSGACERIYSSPVPLVYTRLTSRILSFWLLLLPLGLFESFESTWNHIVMIPCCAISAFFYFGIEELAVQLEEPFSILPLDKMADGIYTRGTEYVSYHTTEQQLLNATTTAT